MKECRRWGCKAWEYIVWGCRVCITFHAQGVCVQSETVLSCEDAQCVWGDAECARLSCAECEDAVRKRESSVCTVHRCGGKVAAAQARCNAYMAGCIQWYRYCERNAGVQRGQVGLPVSCPLCTPPG